MHTFHSIAHFMVSRQKIFYLHRARRKRPLNSLNRPASAGRFLISNFGFPSSDRLRRWAVMRLSGSENYGIALGFRPPPSFNPSVEDPGSYQSV